MKRKILFIGLGKEFGGVEQFVFNLCNSRIREKYEFGFLSYYSISEKAQVKIENLGARKWKVCRYSRNPIRFWREIHRFYQENREYDVIYCNASHASMILYTLPVWWNRRKKVIFHSHASDGAPKWLQFIMQKIVNWRSDIRVACSIPASKWMYGNTVGVEIIHNGINTERFRFNRNSRNILRKQFGLESKFVVGHVGRFVPVKNHLFLIDIFKEICKLKEDAVLVLVGEGELQEQIIGTAKSLGIGGRVLIFPFQEEVQNYYSMMDVFVLPSKAEGFPLVGIEVQANGLPVFCSDTVPEELKKTDLMHFISLRNGPKQWAEEIISVSDLETGIREEYCDLIFRAGLDIEQAADRVDSLFKLMTSKQ
ncbi:MAG TPA: hypothetical protein DCR27_00080 [Lachnospiraceae bacterium]|nr:hypothetical protein [Lachnospiraceae bacterium]